MEYCCQPGDSITKKRNMSGESGVNGKGAGAGELARGVVDAGDNDTVVVYLGEVVKIVAKVQATPTVQGPQLL